MNLADAIYIIGGLEKTESPKEFLEAAVFLAQPETRKRLSNPHKQIIASLFKRNVLREDEYGNVLVNGKSPQKAKKKVVENEVINQKGEIVPSASSPPKRKAPPKSDMDYIQALMIFDGSIEPKSAEEFLQAAIIMAKDAGTTGMLQGSIGRRLQSILDTGVIYRGLEGDFHIDYEVLDKLESR